MGASPWVIYFAMSVVEILSGASVSVLIPFFPIVTEKKGLSYTTTGIIYSLCPLVGFVLSPYVGTIMSKYGRRRLYFGGNFLDAICTIMFAFVDHLNGPAFIAVACILRVIIGIGSAFYTTAVFALMASQFPSKLKACLTGLEIVASLGLMLGPAMGGYLFDVGGFALPFIVAAALVLLSLIPTYYIMPEESEVVEEDVDISLGVVLRVPQVIVSVFACTLAMSAFVFVDVILPVHLERQFSMSPTPIGIILSLPSLIFLIFALVLYLFDDLFTSFSSLCLGLLLVALSFLAIGPSPLLSVVLPANIRSIIFSMAITGVGVCLVFVCVMPYMIESLSQSSSLSHLNKDQITDIASGLNTSAISLGQTAGPLIASALYENLGFRWSTTLASLAFFGLLGICLVMRGVLSVSSFLSGSKAPSRHAEGRNDEVETAPLLRPTNNYFSTPQPDGESFNTPRLPVSGGKVTSRKPEVGAGSGHFV